MLKLSPDQTLLPGMHLIGTVRGREPMQWRLVHRRGGLYLRVMLDSGAPVLDAPALERAIWERIQ